MTGEPKRKCRKPFCTPPNNLALWQKVKEYQTGLPVVTKKKTNSIGALMESYLET